MGENAHHRPHTFRWFAALVGLAAVLIAWLAWESQPAAPTGPSTAPRRVAAEAQDTAPPAQRVDGGPDAPSAATRSAAEPADTERDGSVAVDVFWSDGEPAVGVRVYASSELSAGARLGDWDATTGPDGRASFPSFRCGPVGVRCDRGGRASCQVRAGEVSRVRLQIRAGLDVRGRVEDPDGHPVPRAGIWLTRDRAGSWMSGAFVAEADASGEFRVRDVPPDQSVGAIAPGFCPSDFADLELLDTSRTPVWVVLRLPAPGGRCELRVVDDAGQPIAGAKVALGEVDARTRTLTEDPRSPRTAVTDEGGSCVVEGMAPGNVPAEVVAPGHPRWRAQVEIAAGETTEVRVELPRGATVSGTVRSADGAALAGVLVVALLEPTPENGTIGHANLTPFSHPAALSAADGTFELHDVMPGELYLLARAERAGGAGSGRPWTQSTATAAPGDRVRWDPVIDAGLTITGFVRDPSGQAVEGASVRLVRSRGGGALRAFSDDGGRFGFVRLSDQPYDVTVSDASGRVGAEVTGVVPGGGPIEVIVGSRPPGTSGSVRGSVVDLASRLEPGARHRAQLQGPAGSRRVDLSDLAFEFVDVEPGDYVVAILSGTDCVHRTDPFAVAPAENVVLDDIATTPGASLVVELQRRPETTSRAIAIRVSETRGGPTYLQSVRGDRAVFDNCVAGIYRVQLVGRETATETHCADAAQQVELLPAATSHCTFEVRDAALVQLEIGFPRGDPVASIRLTNRDGWVHETHPAVRRGTARKCVCWLSVPPGLVEVEAVTDKGVRATTTATIGAGAHRDVLRLEIE